MKAYKELITMHKADKIDHLAQYVTEGMDVKTLCTIAYDMLYAEYEWMSDEDFHSIYNELIDDEE
jgi:hypothetical protein